MGHFDYLLDGSTPARASSDRLQLLAKTAAKRFVEEQIPLNTTIGKIASENDLNPNQIARVCEMANLTTHQLLWSKTAAKTEVSFELADAKKIGSAGSRGTEKNASAFATGRVLQDYLGPPTGLPHGPSTASMFKVAEEQHPRTLWDITPQQRLRKEMTKKAAERGDCQARALMAKLALDQSIRDSFEAVKQAVGAGESMRSLFHAAAEAGYQKEAAELFPVFEKKLIADSHGDLRRRLEKTAIMKAPLDLISDNLDGVTIVNSAHPVLVSLDTVRRQDGSYRFQVGGLIRAEDELKVLGQRVKELS